MQKFWYNILFLRGLFDGRCAGALVLALAMLNLNVPPARAWTAQSLHEVNYLTEAGVTLRGNFLYGVVTYGGANGCGYVFRIGINGGAPLILHQFAQGPNGGCYPFGEVTFGPDNALYGTASDGGTARCPLVFSHRCGIVFRLAPRPAPNPWGFSIIHKFGGGAQGFTPVAGVVFGDNGRIYGTTKGGLRQGATACTQGSGWTVYELTRPPPGRIAWTHRVIYTAAFPITSPVTFGPDDALYGTEGGSCIPATRGRVFKLAPPVAPSTAWRGAILHAFTGSAAGGSPAGGLIVPTSSLIYGTTVGGGTSGKGTVFRLVRGGGRWTHSVLFNFTSGEGDNQNPGGPRAELLRDPATGFLYGTTWAGGLGDGTVFQLKPRPGGALPWILTDIFRFSLATSSPGDRPSSPLIFNANATSFFGTSNSHVFRLTP
jgi:uncharacterized repeat protein (TIGR03803 family)